MSAAKKPSSRAKTKTKTKTPAAAAEPVDPRLAAIAKLFARNPKVTLGKMMASMGLKVDGKIFAMVVKGKLVVKLPKARVSELVAAKAGSYFDPGHGRLMKEWIAITAERLDAAALGREAFAYVAGE
jgi:TfoX/Sxy family transcriptional regulator of competence genes